MRPMTGTARFDTRKASQPCASPCSKAMLAANVGMSHSGSAPPPARATSGTTSMRAQPAGTALRSASARRSARTRTASSGSESMRSVGMEASARSGSRYRRSVASSAASVILSRRIARASGFFFRRPISCLDPTTMPACGPPSSLSPENDTRSHPPRSDSATVGSACAPKQARLMNAPDPWSSYTSTSPSALAARRRSFSASASARSSRMPTCSEKPTMR